MITLRNKKPDFRRLFNTFISNYHTSIYSNYPYDNYEDYDDWYDDDYYSDWYPFSYSKKSKSKHKSRKKNNKCIPLYPKKNSSKISNLLNDDFNIIYFYHNINDPDNSCETFFSLAEFDQFLDDNGIIISESEVTNLMNRPVSHCCINPLTKNGGIKELITASNYGSLKWDCASSDKEFIN